MATTAALREEILAFQYQALSGNVVESFKFEGFDATHIFALLKAKNTNAASFTLDMNTLCLVGMMRGTRCDKIVTSMSTAGRNSLTGLINKYTIVPKVIATNKKNSITIGRIMSVFPQICLQHAVAGHIRDFGLAGEFALPVQCRFPQFAALIPTGWENMWEAYLLWANAMDVVIKGNDANEDLVEKYATTTNNNNMFTNDMRIAILTQCGITE